MLDWLIIGGGIHGVHIAGRLLAEADIAADNLRIIDPEEKLLQRWRTLTTNIGMSHLRSPSVHHLDLHPMALQHFAGKKRKNRKRLFSTPFERPALTLFNDHCDMVINKFNLAKLHIRARVMTCEIKGNSVMATLSDGQSFHARNIVLAIGASEEPEWPQWAPRDTARVHHVFEPGFEGWPKSTEQVIVLGGGVTAGQVALRLMKGGHAVHLVSRHELRRHQFDSAPGWLGPKFMNAFNDEKDANRRRAIIFEARNRGSLPPHVYRRIRRAVHKGELAWHKQDVKEARCLEDLVQLRCQSGEVIEGDRLLLATGFAHHRPGGSLVDDLVKSHSLACAQCGYPIVDRFLRWHSRIFVSGALAELELGPIARNIVGARRAADRLVKIASAKAKHHHTFVDGRQATDNGTKAVSAE